LDLGITQKSLRVRLREEKVIHSFMSRLKERESKRAREISEQEEKEAAAWHAFQGSL